MLSKQPRKKSQVSSKEQMSPNTSNILLIVIIVILVGVLGVAVGYIYFGSLNHPNTILNNTTSNSTNQTNSTPNNISTVQTNTTPPQQVSIDDLYNNAVPVGTYVTVVGTAEESDQNNLRMEDPAGNDIMVQGDNVIAADGMGVVVTGYYKGLGTYDTADGSYRSIPFVINAKVSEANETTLGT